MKLITYGPNMYIYQVIKTKSCIWNFSIQLYHTYINEYDTYENRLVRKLTGYLF